MRTIFALDVSLVYTGALLHVPNSHQTVEEVTEDGAPAGKKDFIIWEPPRLLEGSSQTHASPVAEATGLMRYLMKRGVRVILFCKASIWRIQTQLVINPITQIRKSCEHVQY